MEHLNILKYTFTAMDNLISTFTFMLLDFSNETRLRSSASLYAHTSLLDTGLHISDLKAVIFQRITLLRPLS